ncbi:MAG: FKBP-type peptidyl-prolyl cis-trans isomerase [Hyphomonadaceae bacterium]
MIRRVFLAAALALSACASAPSPEENLARSNAFLAENARAEGVQTTASGLQYRVVRAASDADAIRPRAEDIVSVRYRGTFPNGREFDSSTDPIEFPLNRVIRGWTEGVALMRVGEEYDFFIPPALAYGERGTGDGTIPPNQALVFRVELLGVTRAP